MVSSQLVTHDIDSIVVGLSDNDQAIVRDAYDFAKTAYQQEKLQSGELAIDYVINIATILAQLNTDYTSRVAGLFVVLPEIKKDVTPEIEKRFGVEVLDLIIRVGKLFKLRDITGALDEISQGKNTSQIRKAQAETLRKMMLAMASDMRVVMIRLAARMASLRYLGQLKEYNEKNKHYAKETLEIYAPLANRLGIWQVKWELEDMAFRFIDPVTYKTIAKALEEKRVEREAFIKVILEELKTVLKNANIPAEISGRPKHIYSIYNKMQGKQLNFSQMYDLRAFRVIVHDIKDCFSALDVIHRRWTPILKEFDDYISKPKPNGYQSLHTVVVAENGQPFEVQIRTEDMHQRAEYGVASHWRYKETGGSTFSLEQGDDKISFLRQLLSWKSDVDDTVTTQENSRKEWVEKVKTVHLDDRIYALTPQARIIDLPKGATPIDFAYQIHSDVGHRCRGARVDGQMVPLNTPLQSGQTVEIITAKGQSDSIGPSRDWLSPGYAVSSRTQSKIRAWFNGVEYQETIANGRAIIEKILQREGKTAVKLEDLAKGLDFAKVDDFFYAVGKEKVNLKSVEQLLRGSQKQEENTTQEQIVHRSRADASSDSAVLVNGTSGLLTQMSKCCRPAPPDKIVGFITRGKGVSIHRADCKNFLEMQRKNPERVIETHWGKQQANILYPVDIYVLANDRQGLLRDISDVFMREKINVIGVHTQSNKGQARMSFTVEVNSTHSLDTAISSISEVKGVVQAKRH